MSFETPKNPNYVATVIRVEALEPLENLDNLVALRALGMQALVSKNTQVGDVGILFSTEVQLSDEYARANNLYRDKMKNGDKNEAGYLDDNRRVKAIKLRKERSDSLFMPLSSLSYLGIVPRTLNVGDVFDVIDGHEICRKYEVKIQGVARGPQAKVRRIDLKSFPMHLDSENYWRNAKNIPENREVFITQKLHGTSGRFGWVETPRALRWYERFLSKLGVNLQATELSFVVGSRKVVKSVNFEAEDGKEHFYDADLWTAFARNEEMDTRIPKGFIVYGELVGKTPEGGEIQANYTYGYKAPRLFVYRVATVVHGTIVDLSWDQVKSFCVEHGFDYVPELAVMRHGDFQVDTWMDKRYSDVWLEDSTLFNEPPVRLSNADTVDEGVCVRWDGPHGTYILKAKSPIFLGHESDQLDKGVADLEAVESVDTE